jgi:signal transduction histidine kinase
MYYFNPYAIPGLISGISVICFGIVIYIRNRRNILSRIIFFWCLSAFVWLFGYTLCYSTNNADLAEMYAKIACGGVTFLAVSAYHFAVAFLKLRSEYKFLYTIYGMVILIIPFYIFSDYFLSGVNKYFFGYYGKATPYYIYYLIFFFLILFRVFFLLYKKGIRNKDLSPPKAIQVKYVFFGFLIASLATIDYLPKYGIEFYPFGYSFMLIWIFITSYAIFRHHLLDINIAIKKGLVYSVLVAIITAGYLIFVITIGRLFQGLVGYQSFVVNLVAIFVIALFFNPLRDRIQHFLDKRFFKGTLESLANERQRLQQELFQTEKLAYMGRLASSVVHEIKNPLTVIKTFAEYLPQKYNEPEFKKKISEILPQQINRIEGVVEQLLDLARPRKPIFRKINIINIIDETLSLLENNFRQKNINIRRNYQSDEILILGDKEQLKQVFLNLFLNSIQAMPKGGKIEISTNLCTTDLKSMIICVRDTGCGISEENLSKLFTPFFTTKKEGIGLGLVISQEIIKNHKGRISVKSQENKGTEFIIELPLS